MQLKKQIFHAIMVVAVSVMLFGGRAAYAQEGEASYSPEEENGFLAILYPMKNVILSSEVAGTIKRIKHDMGQFFKKGDVLITLNSGKYYAEWEKTKAIKAFTRKVLDSKTELYNQKSVSTLEYTKAEADFQRAKSDFGIAGNKLAACTIRGPYDGKIVKLLVRENEYVTEGQQLVEIINDKVIRVKFHLPSTYYPAVKVGQRCTVTIKNLSASYECRITHISPVLEANTGSFQVFAELKNDSYEIQGGMTGFITILPGGNDS